MAPKLSHAAAWSPTALSAYGGSEPGDDSATDVGRVAARSVEDEVMAEGEPAAEVLMVDEVGVRPQSRVDLSPDASAEAMQH